MKYKSIRTLLPYYNDNATFMNRKLLDTVLCELDNTPNILLSDIQVSSMSARDKEKYTALLSIEYQPNQLLLELFSLHDYLTSFRDATTHLEQLLDIIYTDLILTVKPRVLKLTLQRKTLQGFPATLVIDSQQQR
ncbi:hypothetical protein KCM76_10400 [Zooshikella marina]|uniref:hypothetical protein n=1 Tax=Zooshikella ganghwensis TaxID=202772 RepID=UPI001BB0137F|nr:hypothetical protein [Zooshikella ganghwensis]MBU2706399.1 hypothetical protein [Zooshikella ganghwensis]